MGCRMEYYLRTVDAEYSVQRRSVANGKYLFGGKYIVEERKDEYLNMATVVGYEMSDEGVMLITDDGNGYFIEK